MCDLRLWPLARDEAREVVHISNARITRRARVPVACRVGAVRLQAPDELERLAGKGFCLEAAIQVFGPVVGDAVPHQAHDAAKRRDVNEWLAACGLVRAHTRAHLHGQLLAARAVVGD